MADQKLDANALRAALAARESSGAGSVESPLSLEEIWAQVAGTLPSKEAASVLDRLADDTEAARLAASMASFHAARDAVSSRGSDESAAILTAQELEQDWQRLRGRVGMSTPASELAEGPRSVPAVASSALKGPDSEEVAAQSWRTPAWALAAGLLAALGVGWVGQTRLETQRLAPRVNVPSTSLWEDAARSGDARPTQILGGGPFDSLSLTLPQEDGDTAGSGFDRYALEIRSREEPNRQAAIWRADPVRLEEGRIVTLELVNGFLAPGVYELRLLGMNASREKVVATFAIEVP